TIWRSLNLSLDQSILTPGERAELEHTVLAHERLEEQFENLEHQHEAASLGMWVFLATEVMFFGALFVGLSAYQYQFPHSFEQASEHLNWAIGGVNMLVLLSSSLMMALAVHYAQLGARKALVLFLVLTVSLGSLFLVLKGIEYYLDFVDHLVPGLSFEPSVWRERGAEPRE